MVETACDAVENNDYNSADIESDLGSKLVDTLQPVTQQLLDTVHELVGALYQDYTDGDSTEKAIIATGCAANSVHGNFG